MSAYLLVKPIATKSSTSKQQELLAVIYLNICLNTRFVTWMHKIMRFNYSNLAHSRL